MIVLDASFLVAFLNEDDAHHKAAARTMAEIEAGTWGAALLPEYVFLETVTVLASRAGIEVAQEAGSRLLSSQDAEIVPCSPYFEAAFVVFREQRKTRLSFADAAIVAIARDRAAAHVATFDRDFLKVGGITVVPS